MPRTGQPDSSGRSLPVSAPRSRLPERPLIMPYPPASSSPFQPRLIPAGSRRLDQSPRSELQGTGLLADDLYFLAHDDRTGRPQLKSRPLGIALAGALLCEMWLSGLITVAGDGLVYPARAGRPEPLTARVLHVMTDEGVPRPSRAWLVYLAETAADEIGARLERAGFLVRDGGWPWRPRRRPVNPDWAFAAVGRARRVRDVDSALLWALADASHLGFRFIDASSLPDREHTASLLPPGLAELVAVTKTAIDSALLSHRP